MEGGYEVGINFDNGSKCMEGGYEIGINVFTVGINCKNVQGVKCMG